MPCVLVLFPALSLQESVLWLHILVAVGLLQRDGRTGLGKRCLLGDLSKASRAPEIQAVSSCLELSSAHPPYYQLPIIVHYYQYPWLPEEGAQPWLATWTLVGVLSEIAPHVWSRPTEWWVTALSAKKASKHSDRQEQLNTLEVTLSSSRFGRIQLRLLWSTKDRIWLARGKAQQSNKSGHNRLTEFVEWFLRRSFPNK